MDRVWSSTQARVVRKGLPAGISDVYRGTINYRSLQVP